MSAGDWKELYKAASEGNVALVQYHIQGGVDANYQHPEIQSTPLVAAIESGHTEVALFLLKSGADPNLESYFEGVTPLKSAQRKKNNEVIAAIRKLL